MLLNLVRFTEEEQVNLILEVLPEKVKEAYVQLLDDKEIKSQAADGATQPVPTVSKLSRLIDKLTLKQLEVLINKAQGQDNTTQDLNIEKTSFLRF